MKGRKTMKKRLMITMALLLAVVLGLPQAAFATSPDAGTAVAFDIDAQSPEDATGIPEVQSAAPRPFDEVRDWLIPTLVIFIILVIFSYLWRRNQRNKE